MGSVWEMVILEPFELVMLRRNGQLITLVNLRCWYPNFSASIVMLNKATAAVRIGPQIHCAKKA